MIRPAAGHAWASRVERGSPFLIRFIAWLARTVGRRPTRLLLPPICLYFLVCAPDARRHSWAYLERVLDRRPTISDVYRHIHTFAATILDRVFFMTDRFEVFDLRFEGLEELEAARAKNKGVVLLGAHVGSFDAMRGLAAGHGRLPLKVLMHTGAGGRVARVIHAINPEIAESIIPLGETSSLLTAHEWLHQNGMIGLLGDRLVRGDKTQRVDFLGGRPELPEGPWLLAALTGAPVVMFAALYLGDNRYVIRFRTLSENVARPRERADGNFGPEMQDYASTLESWVCTAPYNWFNFYEFWT